MDKPKARVKGKAMMTKAMMIETGRTAEDILERLRCWVWFYEWFEDIPQNSRAGVRRAIKNAIIAHDRRKAKHEH